MTGQQLKSKIVEVGKSQKDIAELLGVTAQSLSSILNAKDVRSGTIERIAEALGVNMSFFYPADSNNAIASGNSSVAVNTNTGHINASGGDTAALRERIAMLEQLLDERNKLIDEKERTIKILMKE